MPGYVIFFSYTAATWGRLTTTAGDRTAAIRAAAEAAGAALRGVHWMTGPCDGLVLLEAPDAVSAAAVSATAMASGAFRTVETHRLFTQDELGALLQMTATAGSAYTPPGQ